MFHSLCYTLIRREKSLGEMCSQLWVYTKYSLSRYLKVEGHLKLPISQSKFLGQKIHFKIIVVWNNWVVTYSKKGSVFQNCIL